MKKKLQRSILFVLFLSFTGLLTAQTNLLPSGFFGFEETDPPGWFMNAASDPYVAISNEQAATGTASLKFNFPDYSALSDGSTSILAESGVPAGAKVDVAAGTYTMKVKVYVADNAPGLFKTIFKPGWIQVDWDISGIETGKWVELEQTVTLPEFVDGGMVVQVYQTAFTVMEGAGSFYVDDIEIFEPGNDNLDNPDTPMDEHYYSFELGAGTWYTPAGQVQYVDINDVAAASGLYSMQFSFADYSTVYNSVNIWSQSKPDWNMDFEMGKFYEMKLKIYMEDEAGAAFPSGFETYIKNDGAGIGYQTINWEIDDISERDVWVEKTQVFLYSGEGLSQGEIVSRQLVIQIGSGLFPETGSGTFRVDDISIVEIEPTTYPLALAVDPSEIATDADVQGAGDYIEAMDVQISASAVTGYEFTGWTGSAEDVALLADASAIETSFTMPARNVSFTATYEQQTTYPVVLGVDPSEIATDANVQGAGDYAEATDVQISASTVTGYDFTGWTGSAEDVALLADASVLATSFTMPDRSISLTATYEEQPTYSLVLAVDPSEIATDANIQGAGDYLEATDVQISVSTVDGYDFAGWTGSAEDIALVADASAMSTSFTMPDRSISLTATFTEVTNIVGREVPVINVYPVPAADIITVEASEMMQQIRIVDISGKILSDHTVRNRVENLDISSLLPGHYFMQVITSDQSLVLPVQIVR